jgi:lysophospholipase L1-like esterase
MPAAPPPRRFPTVVFYGDSISTGWRGITSPRARWTSLVSDELGWHEVNLSIDGMAFYRRRGARPSAEQPPSDSVEDTTLLDTAIRLAPAAVVVSLGANDSMLLEGNEGLIRDSIHRDLRRLRDELPGRPVVVAPFFTWSQLPPRTGQIVTWEREAADEYGHLFLDALFTPIEAEPSMLCDDGIHPNDLGHRALADSILPQLRSLDLG